MGIPTLRAERDFWEQGHQYVVGIDEVGRGAWAGPVSVGAAVVPHDTPLDGIRDSKMLSEKARERLFAPLGAWCVTWAVGHATHHECDLLGMTTAQQLAARRALQQLAVRPDQILLDGRVDFIGDIRTNLIVKGDQSSVSIAAASILAKVVRDRLMRGYSDEFPEFDFASNKGYPAPAHRRALQSFGPTTIHRRSWAFMDDLPGHERFRREQQSLFDDPVR